MSRAIKRYLKQADWFGRPKWMTDPNWSENEEALNDIYEAVYNNPDRSTWDKASTKLADLGYWATLDRSARYNLHNDRHTTVSDALLNRARHYYDDDSLNILRSADRTDSLARVRYDLSDMLSGPRAFNIGYAKLTPKGEQAKALHDDIDRYLNAPASVHSVEKVTPEIAKRYQPTPYQRSRWFNLENMDINREARKSALKGALGGGAVGALTGFGLGMLPASEYGVGKYMMGTPGRAAVLAALLGGSTAAVGGFAGYRHRLNNLRARRDWALKQLKEIRE